MRFQKLIAVILALSIFIPFAEAEKTPSARLDDRTVLRMDSTPQPQTIGVSFDKTRGGKSAARNKRHVRPAALRVAEKNSGAAADEAPPGASLKNISTE
jgi:hypothetical protein